MQRLLGDNPTEEYTPRRRRGTREVIRPLERVMYSTGKEFNFVKNTTAIRLRRGVLVDGFSDVADGAYWQVLRDERKRLLTRRIESRRFKTMGGCSAVVYKHKHSDRIMFLHTVD